MDRQLALAADTYAPPIAARELAWPAADARAPRLLLAAGLGLLLAIFYVAQIGRWPLDGDEIYTYYDSRIPASQILQQQREKPLYYLLCHGMLKLPLSVEVALRLPGALAAACIAPVFYLALARREPAAGLCAALLVAFNPWILELSQFGRFYSTAFLFASIGILAFDHWVATRRTSRLVVFVGSVLLAALSHTTAILLLPAGALAALVISARRDPRSFIRTISRHWMRLAATAGALVAVLFAILYQPFTHWLSTLHGSHGDYSPGQLVASIVIGLGLQVWALAVIPLAKPLRQWTDREASLVILVVAPSLVMVTLSPLGGGVASRYLLNYLPAVVLLASRHLAHILHAIPSWRLQGAALAAMLAFYVPYFISNLQNGSHYDYRTAARFVQSLELDDPILASTSHGLYMHHAGTVPPVVELGTLSEIDPRSAQPAGGTHRRLVELMRQADEQSRPLLLISREDRSPFSLEQWKWLGSRFAVLAVIEQPRYDHRRNRLVVYQYRPDAER